MIWPASVYSNRDSKVRKTNLKDSDLLMLGVFSSKVIFLHIGCLTLSWVTAYYTLDGIFQG